MGKLATYPETGIMGDARDLKRREKTFGANSKPLPRVVSVLDSVKQEASNIIWLVLGASALFAGLCGLFVNDALQALLEAVSIVLIAILILVANAASDWHKDKSFVKLRSMVKDEKLIVIRGKHNATKSISVWSIVVGDIVLL